MTLLEVMRPYSVVLLMPGHHVSDPKNSEGRTHARIACLKRQGGAPLVVLPRDRSALTTFIAFPAHI